MLANHRRAALGLMLAAAACSPPTEGIDPEGKTFDGIAPEEVVNLVGTEPFWALTIDGAQGRWTTPDNQDGTAIALTRFAGNNGLGYSGELDGKPFTATLTPGACSDGMSDRSFPFVATIALGGETLQGCGYTDRQPYTGGEAP